MPPAGFKCKQCGNCCRNLAERFRPIWSLRLGMLGRTWRIDERMPYAAQAVKRHVVRGPVKHPTSHGMPKPEPIPFDPSSAWAHAEIDREIARLIAKGEWSEETTLSISNPAWREELVRLIRSDIWAGVLRIFDGTELNANPATDDGQPRADVERGPEAAVSFLFLVDSDEDPWSEDGRDPYFCRMTVTCRPRGFFLGTDFHVHFPETTDANWLKPLLGSPKFSGNPPSLVYEIGHGDLPGVLVVWLLSLRLRVSRRLQDVRQHGHHAYAAYVP